MQTYGSAVIIKTMKKIKDIKASLRITSVTVFIFIFSYSGNSQNLSQTVKGSVVDADTKSPLIYANIIIPGTNPVIEESTGPNTIRNSRRLSKSSHFTAVR